MAKVSQQPSDTSKSSEMQNAYLKDGTSYLYVENWEYYLNENNYQLTRYSMPLVTPLRRTPLPPPPNNITSTRAPSRPWNPSSSNSMGKTAPSTKPLSAF